MDAINHALRILGWYENLPEDEQPPEWMWPFEEEIKEWFDDVKERREEKYGGGGSSSSREETHMMSNELARGRG